MATATKSTLMGVGDDWQSVVQALDEAQGRKAKGNSLFGEGKHDEAVAEYNKALTGLQKLGVTTRGSPNQTGPPQIVALMVALRSNLAACFLAVGQHLQAATESQAALALDPLHVKSHARLSKAMYSLGRVAEAAEAMAVSVALMLPGSLDEAMLRIYKELVVLSTGLQFKLPSDISSIACVDSDRKLGIALLLGKSVAILKSGLYSSALGYLDLEGPLALIGLGTVEITSGDYGHQLYVVGGEVYACHLKLVGRKMASAVCVGGQDARLTLVDCAVHDHKDVGVLVTQGHAILERCTFGNLSKQAVEVREGGSAELRECCIKKCHQGVIAYGGARRLEMINCEIQDTIREGVLVNGENHNAATRAQRQLCDNRPNDPASRAASEWGQTAGILLEVVISSSVVKGSRYFGLSLDQGARVSVINSVLADNTPSACFLKGATTALVAGCHIESGKKCDGLHVAANYGATVTATGNTFVVADRESAIVEEMSSGFCSTRLMQNTKKMFGLWSKPVINRNNQIFLCKCKAGTLRDNAGISVPSVPTLEELAARGIQKWGSVRSSEAPGLRGPGGTGATHLSPLACTSRLVCNDLQKRPQFYAVGNTFGYDLSLGQELSAGTDNKDVNGILQPSAPLTIRILLGACGDIRNLLKTVSSLQPRLDTLGAVQIVLSDSNVAILARDVLLLSLIAQGTSAADVVAIWANHALTGPQRKLLDYALVSLATSLPDWLVLPAEPSCNLAAELLEAFASWRDCTMTLQELLELHDQSVTSNTTLLESAIEFVGYAVGHIRFDKQIRRHINSGNVCNTTKDMQSANPTLLEAPSLQYLLYWSSSIYRAVKLDVATSTSSDDLYELLLQTVTPQIKAVADLLEQGALRVALMAGNIVEDMLFGGCLRLLHQLNGGPQHPSSSTLLFDFIDLSNVADYVSVPAVVQASLPLLKVVKHAILHMQSLQWYKWTLDPLAFLRCSIGMDLDTYQELLGVKVQAEVVGSSSKPVLQTHWKWDLCATEDTWLTGATVLLAVMTAAKLHCAIDRVAYISNGKFGWTTKGNRIFSGALAGLEYSSPLTMLHLLHLCCPGILMSIMRVLVATDACTHKWELIGHAMFQRDPVNSKKTFIKLVFQANAQFYTLLACGEMPLCLTVSKVPLALGVVASTDVLQLLETFSYCGESDRVEVILQRALAENPRCKAYFMTLCVVAHGTNLQAVGTSVPWSELTIEPLTQGPNSTLPIWTVCEGTAKRALLSEDLELIESIDSAKLPSSSSKEITAQSWKTHAVRETSKFVIVELLLPRPFPGTDDAVISVTSSEASMKVTTKAVLKKKSAKVVSKKKAETLTDFGTVDYSGPGFAFPEEHVIPLPTAVSSGGHSTKVSRKLGIMIVRLPKVV